MFVFSKTKVWLLWFFFSFLIHHSIQAQDISFSQFFISPLYLNPASAGDGETEYRFSSQYRNQWSGLGFPYKTMQASGDFSLFKDDWKKGFPACGISFYSDQAGKSKMGITEIQLTGSYTIHLDEDQTLSSGLQVAYVQRSVDISNLKWDNQYNGMTYDPALSSGESAMAEPFSYVDLGAGFLWKYQAYDDLKYHIGIAGFHLNKPPQSFYNTESDRLHMRFVVNAGSEIKWKEKRMSILPKMLFIRQGGAMNLSAGGLVKYLVGLESRYTEAYTASAVSFGGLYRWADAFSLQAFFDYKNSFSLGLSYDINVSPFHAATNFMGGFEFSLSCKGNVFHQPNGKRKL